MRILCAGALFMAALSTSGCATTEEAGSAMYFDCGTFVLRVADSGRDSITIRRSGELIGTLRKVSTGPGVRYEGEGHSFSIRGAEATYTGLTREAPHECRRVEYLG